MTPKNLPPKLDFETPYTIRRDETPTSENCQKPSSFVASAGVRQA